jgi:hypothetical protein
VYEKEVEEVDEVEESEDFTLNEFLPHFQNDASTLFLAKQ